VFGARKDANASFIPKAVPCFLPDNPRVIVGAFFDKKRCRNPEVRKFDAVGVLVFGRMLEPKGF
jgi:hypothetical protein